jgi:hypothetical protein
MIDEQHRLPFSLLSSEWRNRLRRVAAACYTSPNEFIREAIEAEIVRREILLEQQGALDPQWRALFVATLSTTRLQ